MNDGTKVQFSLDPEYGWQQWGAPDTHLSENVYALANLLEAMVGHWAQDRTDEYGN
jgi:hypothetical protein